jgi:hypothetical protein
MQRGIDEMRKAKLADRMSGVGYADVEGLQIEDVEAMYHRRRDERVEYVR